MVTASTPGLAFTLFGHVLLKAIGIEVADLQIAGGIIPLWMSLQDIVRHKTEEALLMRLLGRSVAMAVSKVFMLIPAACSVMMIRYGALGIAASFSGK